MATSYIARHYGDNGSSTTVWSTATVVITRTSTGYTIACTPYFGRTNNGYTTDYKMNIRWYINGSLVHTETDEPIFCDGAGGYTVNGVTCDYKGATYKYTGTCSADANPSITVGYDVVNGTSGGTANLRFSTASVTVSGGTYATTNGVPGKPSITQNSDKSISISSAKPSTGTANSVKSVTFYYKWNSTTVSTSSYSGTLSASLSGSNYVASISANTVFSNTPTSIAVIAVADNTYFSDTTSSVGTNTSISYYTYVGAATNIQVQYDTMAQKFVVTGNAGTSGTNNPVTGIQWCWERNGMSTDNTSPYTWYDRYSTNTEDHNRGTISLGSGQAFSFEIPLANKDSTHYTFVVYTVGQYDRNYGGDYGGIHVIRNSYTGNTITGLGTVSGTTGYHTTHNIKYAYVTPCTDFMAYRVNMEYCNNFDIYCTAGTCTAGTTIAGIGIFINYYIDENYTQWAGYQELRLRTTAGSMAYYQLSYPTLSDLSEAYVTELPSKLYTNLQAFNYDSDGNDIGPFVDTDLEMIRYSPCVSPKITFPTMENGPAKFVPFTGNNATLTLEYDKGVDGENNPITTYRIDLINYDTGSTLVSTGASVLPLTEIVSLVDKGTPILVRVAAYSSEWGEMWFPTEVPMLDNGNPANEVILHLCETGYVYQRVGDIQQTSFVYTKVNGSWKIATPDILVRTGGSWKGTPDTLSIAGIYG